MIKKIENLNRLKIVENLFDTSEEQIKKNKNSKKSNTRNYNHPLPTARSWKVSGLKGSKKSKEILDFRKPESKTF